MGAGNPRFWPRAARSGASALRAGGTWLQPRAGHFAAAAVGIILYLIFVISWFIEHVLPLAVLFVHRAHERAVPWVTFMPENLFMSHLFFSRSTLTLLILLYSFCAKKERVGTVLLYAVIPEMADSFPDTNGPPNHVLIV